MDAPAPGAPMSNDSHDSRARKVRAALDGADEFSVLSVDPDLRKLSPRAQ